MDASAFNVVLNIAGLLLGGTALGVVLRYKLGRQKITASSEADIRDHYAEEVKALREKLNLQESHFRDLEKHLREIIAASDRRHEECEQARAEDRRERSKMQDEIDGLRRQIVRYSAEGVLVLSANRPSEMVEDAAGRVKRITEGSK